MSNGRFFQTPLASLRKANDFYYMGSGRRALQWCPCKLQLQLIEHRATNKTCAPVGDIFMIWWWSHYPRHHHPVRVGQSHIFSNNSRKFPWFWCSHYISKYKISPKIGQRHNFKIGRAFQLQCTTWSQDQKAIQFPRLHLAMLRTSTLFCFSISKLTRSWVIGISLIMTNERLGE